MGQQITLYRQMMESLEYPRKNLRFYLCEGDSKDDTLGHLQAWALTDERIQVIKHDTGIPREHHTTRPARMKAVSENGNVGWDAIAKDNWGEYALMIESDLLVTPNLLKRLIERMPAEADIFAPMIWIEVGSEFRFYDIWAFRQDFKRFPPTPPSWYANKYGYVPFELDSVGSCVLFRMKPIIDGLRLDETTCVKGMCDQARKQGYRVFADPDIDVIHPSIAGVS